MATGKVKNFNTDKGMRFSKIVQKLKMRVFIALSVCMMFYIFAICLQWLVYFSHQSMRSAHQIVDTMQTDMETYVAINNQVNSSTKSVG